MMEPDLSTELSTADLTDADDVFRRVHGIGRDVWDARGYAHYRSGEAGADDLIEIDPGYGLVPRGKLLFRTRKSGGIAIPRRALPGTSEHPIPLAELRPDIKIVTNTRWHAHAVDPAHPDHEHDVEDPFVPIPREQRRPSRPRRKPEQRVADGEHPHGELAKYIFMTGEPIERVSLHAVLGPGSFWEVSGAANERERQLSQRISGNIGAPWDRAVLESRLGLRLPARGKPRFYRDFGERNIGRVEIDGEEFDVVSAVQPARESEAARVDVNPLAWDMFPDAERIYLSLEGCIKADAMLTSIRATGERATVVSVPSVTLWPKRAGYYGGDLYRLAELARDREVVIVVDSDWDDYRKNRGAVLSQAEKLRDKLVRRGVSRVAVCAPTAEPQYCALHDAEARTKRGVDDSGADGEPLGHLVVIGPRDSSSLFEAVRAAHRPSDGVVVGSSLVVVHDLNLRANPATGTALATDDQLADARLEEGGAPDRRPTGAAPDRDKEYLWRRERHAAGERARLSRKTLRRAGITITALPRVPGAPLPPSRFKLPTTLPDILGSLGSVGVAPLNPLDFSVKRACEECGEPLAGAVRSTARFCSPRCRKAGNRRSRDGDGSVS